MAESLLIGPDSVLIEGLRGMFDVAFQYDVTSLTFPLLLCHELPEHLQSHPLCLARAFTIMRAMHAILLSRTDSTMKTIRLLLPPVSAEVFEKYRAALKSVFANAH